MSVKTKVYYKNMSTGAISASRPTAYGWYKAGATVSVKHYNTIKKTYYTKTVWVHLKGE